MNEIFDTTTLITIAVAVFILLRLRSVLGKRTGYQRPPVDPAELERLRKMKKDGSREESSDNVVALPNQKGAKRVRAEENPALAAINKYAKPGTKLNKGLKEIATATPDFDPENFISGARMAYEMIVTAFADGDKKTLKNLLSREVYEGFAGAITERESRGEQMQSTFIGIEKSAIRSAELNGSDAHVTVEFDSQIISATVDKKGEVVDGDPEQVVDVKDIWTFARDVKSRDPNWKLVATESDI